MSDGNLTCLNLAKAFSNPYSAHLPNARVNQYFQSFILFSGTMWNSLPVFFLYFCLPMTWTHLRGRFQIPIPFFWLTLEPARGLANKRAFSFITLFVTLSHLSPHDKKKIPKTGNQTEATHYLMSKINSLGGAFTELAIVAHGDPRLGGRVCHCCGGHGKLLQLTVPLLNSQKTRQQVCSPQIQVVENVSLCGENYLIFCVLVVDMQRGREQRNRSN